MVLLRIAGGGLHLRGTMLRAAGRMLGMPKHHAHLTILRAAGLELMLAKKTQRALPKQRPGNLGGTQPHQQQGPGPTPQTPRCARGAKQMGLGRHGRGVENAAARRGISRIPPKAAGCKQDRTRPRTRAGAAPGPAPPAGAVDESSVCHGAGQNPRPRPRHQSARQSSPQRLTRALGLQR